MGIVGAPSASAAGGNGASACSTATQGFSPGLIINAVRIGLGGFNGDTNPGFAGPGFSGDCRP